MTRDPKAMAAADVVTVPDFRGPVRALFEARTLLLLGSWLENAGAARWPLHLACIGEPPTRVLQLAERCRARVSVHEPVADGRVPVRNKLRGFDVKPETRNLLLLDTDIVVLGDPSAAPQPGPGLAVARAANHRVRLDTWHRIYDALGEAMLEQRMLCQRAELADHIPPAALHGEHHLEPMHPYYNTGVLRVPWEQAGELRRTWDEYLDRLAAHFPPREPGNRTISGCDQVGFALALRHLIDRGLEVCELPHALHANWVLLLGGAVRAEEVALYHAVHLFRLLDGSGDDWAAEFEAYERFILGHVYPATWRGRATRALRRATGEAPPVAGLRELSARIRALVERYVIAAPSHPRTAAASHVERS